ncbi:prolyl oligopeptidase family serine peptidase [Streptomyces sp. NPDC001380]|uniref:prolyl oligopeptidase family serine peptidase n=1 Tax=Streptomyces sp. NPDC001380 TaxID=3364566 RepID=UPI0036AE2C9D
MSSEQHDGGARGSAAQGPAAQGPAAQDPAPRGGARPSPVTAAHVAAGSGSSSWPSGAGEEAWWCASDPSTATVRLRRALPGGAAQDVLGGTWSVRNRSLGYGGRPYLVAPDPDAGHLLVFTHHGDQRLYRTRVPALRPGGPAEAAGEPVPLTPPDEDGTETCYADPVAAPGGGEVWCVRETTRAATGPDDADPAPRTARAIVAVPLDGSAAHDPARVRVVARSHHFLSGVRISPDGTRLAWIGWDHPRMPWDETRLVVARLEDGTAVEQAEVLGGPGVSVPQAEWRDAGSLYAMADPDGWWNLHRVDLHPDGTATAACVLPMERECADALWRVGATFFAVTPRGVVLRHRHGDEQLALWEPGSGTLTALADGWTEFGSDLWARDGHALVLAGAADRSTALLRVPLPPPGGPVEPPLRCVPAEPDPYAAVRPVGERRTATAADGQRVHYVYWAPTGPDPRGTDAGEGQAPPLLVHVHGGPTSSTSVTPDTETAFFTSRGFAVASVDYGGSTGYGRAYRERLRHSWGTVDVQDSVTAAADLARLGLADPARTAVRGGSAGGWTALACLSSTDAFCCGAVYYPISDPARWSGGETHDFESRYVEGLVGELPRDRERYDRVSPLGNAGRITRPLVMLQGADDFICRPDQAERIVAAVAARGLWHRYLVFEGEGHGFRRASSVAASLEAELELYAHAMGHAAEGPREPAAAGGAAAG